MFQVAEILDLFQFLKLFEVSNLSEKLSSLFERFSSKL